MLEGNARACCRANWGLLQGDAVPCHEASPWGRQPKLMCTALMPPLQVRCGCGFAWQTLPAHLSYAHQPLKPG